MSDPSHSSDPSNLAIGAILRMMFQSGATDEMVTRFVALHANALSATPLAPIIEMGPALQQAAQSAGVEVARELLSQIQSAKGQGARTLVPRADERRSERSVKASKGTSVRITEGGNEIYRFDVASGRTSVSLPADLLAAAKQAFREPDLTKLVQQLYGQALATKASGARTPNSGPVRKVNKSSFVREALAREISVRQATDGFGSSPLH